jgi:hypothetical protein
MFPDDCTRICTELLLNSRYASLAAAVAAIGSSDATLVIKTPVTLTSSITTPPNLCLRIEKGGSIAKASIFHLTINGLFQAGRYKVFNGFSAGDITFGQGSVTEAYPEWWGAQGNDSTESGPSIIEAIATGMPVSFTPKGIYCYDTSPCFAQNNLIVNGNGATLKHTGSEGDAFDLNAWGNLGHGVNNLHLADIIIKGSAASANGIHMAAVWRSRFDNLRVTGASETGAGWLIKNGVYNLINNYTCSSNVGLSPIPMYGALLISSTTTTTFNNIIIEGPAVGFKVSDGTHTTTISGGAIELCGVGVQLEGVAGYNTLISVDMEFNTVHDLEITGYQNTLISCITASESGIVVGGYKNTLISHFVNHKTSVLGTDHVFMTSHLGALTDTSTGTTFIGTS